MPHADNSQQQRDAAMHCIAKQVPDIRANGATVETNYGSVVICAAEAAPLAQAIEKIMLEKAGLPVPGAPPTMTPLPLATSGQSDESLLLLLEDTANLLAGMQFDMTIPAHARECMSAKVEALNTAIDAMTDR